MSNEEIELRLAVDPRQLSRLRRLSVLSEGAVGRARTERMRSIYFDTPDRDLKRANVTLRVREVGRRRLQTAKFGSGFHAGAAHRAEYESWITGDRPDVSAVANTPVGAVLLRDRIFDRLAPAFETEVRRTKRLLKYRASDGTEAEISADLDVGEIRAGEASTPLAELELELKTGSPRALYDLALAVNEQVPVRIGHFSKAARAGSLADAEPPKPMKAGKVTLPTNARVDVAAALVIADCHEQIAGNEAAVLLTPDPEGPHQMRIGMRRLRAALALFRPILPADDVAALREELRWAAGALGEAREWDVFLDDILAPVRALDSSRAGLDLLTSTAEGNRSAGYVGAREAVASPRFTRLQLLIGRLVQGLREQAADAGSTHLALARDFASTRLQRRYSRILKGGRRMLAGDAQAVHDLRLEFKKMRYASEFFGSLFERKPARRFAAAAADVQDLLGHANDLAVAEQQVDRLIGACPPGQQKAVTLAAGTIVGWHAREMVEAEPRIEAAWRRFVGSGRFWKAPA